MNKKKTQKPQNIYYHGKNTGWKQKTHKDNPTKGAPNTNIDFYNAKTGRIHRRRKLDNSGNAYLDLDVADKRHVKDHAHEWKQNNKNIRDKSRNLTKREKRELEKAKKKRKGVKK